ncbi:carboxyltransferase domain-containing protein [Actinomadura sp. NPDC049382]|uniref:carboxyltransferase domain-containing protein n=1 Tax=Actinomadura sp. NPDC049382 TaxID=3158220 RepID=UPI00342A97FE
MRIIPSGDAALLVELPDLAAMLGLYAALAASPPPGVADVVPAARTLTLPLDPSASQRLSCSAVRG